MGARSLDRRAPHNAGDDEKRRSERTIALPNHRPVGNGLASPPRSLTAETSAKRPAPTRSSTPNSTSALRRRNLPRTWIGRRASRPAQAQQGPPRPDQARSSKTRASGVELASLMYVNRQATKSGLTWFVFLERIGGNVEKPFALRLCDVDRSDRRVRRCWAIR